MSRGLGKVERYVLAYMGEHGEEVEITDIARQRAHDEWLASQGRTCDHTHACCDDESYAPYRAEYESVRRAVRSLERKGLAVAVESPRRVMVLLK